jgi:hypothetical protein
MRVRAFVPLVVLLGSVVSPVQGQSVLFDGGTAAYNAAPFSIESLTYDRYQQVYSGSKFSDPLTITHIRFFAGPLYPAGFDGALYHIFLSSTSAQVNGLSHTFSNNVGTDATQVFAGMLSGTFTDQYTLALTTPFSYNPQAGNLLLDVHRIEGARGTVRGAYFQSRTNSTEMSRVYGEGSESVSFSTTGHGLVTEFIAGQSTVTPEPVSMLLLATGLAGVGAAARRRRGAEAARLRHGLPDRLL